MPSTALGEGALLLLRILFAEFVILAGPTRQMEATTDSWGSGFSSFTGAERHETPLPAR